MNDCVLTEEWKLATQLRVKLTTSIHDNIVDIENMRELAWRLVEALEERDKEHGKD